MLYRLLRINLPAGAHPTAITFSDGASTVVVAAQVLSGSSLYAYGDVSLKPAGEGHQQVRPSLPETKWEHHKVHDQRSMITLFGTKACYGTADRSTVIVSCSEGTACLRNVRASRADSFFFLIDDDFFKR